MGQRNKDQIHGEHRLVFRKAIERAQEVRSHAQEARVHANDCVGHARALREQAALLRRQAEQYQESGR